MDDAEDADESEEEAKDDDLEAPFLAPPPPRQGFFSRLFGKKPPPSEPAWSVDPVQEILALPRGAARLDAFEAKLRALPPGSVEHRRVAVAFHKELTGLIAQAGVDLALFESRVTACARALIAAGEDEKAGELFARVGRRHQAAELFVKAGAIEALEEQHAELAFAEGGPRLDARLSFERFEALFLVGRRDEALAALEHAVKLWDNPVYVEVRDGFRARIPAPGRLTLMSGEDVVRVVPRFPVVLGRGEESAVRIDSPLVSRAHVEIVRESEQLAVRDLVSAGGTRVDGVVVDGRAPLSSSGSLDLAGVVIDYERDPQRLSLRPRLRPRHVTIVALGRLVDDAGIGAPIAVRDDGTRLVAGPRARLNGEEVRLDTLLLVGDRITVSGPAGGRTWAVSSA